MGRLERGFDAVLRMMARLAAVVFACIAALIPIDLVLRNAFDASIYGLLDAIEYGLLAATFLAAPWVLSINAHVSVDLFVALLTGRARRVADALANLVGAGAASVFLWFAVVAAAQSIERGTMIRTAFVIPEWWVLSVAPVSMGLILVEFARRLLRTSGANARTGL
jgi:TRAP-type C4-dicarboxylate transport system permease small subunit